MRHNTYGRAFWKVMFFGVAAFFIVIGYWPKLCQIAFRANLISPTVEGVHIKISPDWAPMTETSHWPLSVFLPKTSKGSLVVVKPSKFAPGVEGVMIIRRLSSPLYEELESNTSEVVQLSWGELWNVSKTGDESTTFFERRKQLLISVSSVDALAAISDVR